MSQSQFKSGDPYTLCQRTGFKVRVSETVVEPRTKLRVLKSHADPRHPTDHIRGKKDKQIYRRLISENEDRFLGVGDVTKDNF